MRKSKILGLNLPEKNGADVADIDVITADLKSLEDAMMAFDKLADKFGYDYAETAPSGMTTHTETVKSGCPVTATRVTVESVDGSGNDVFTITVTIDGKAIIQKVTVGETTANMEVM